ncbi:MAG TPA: DUF1579 family protein [Steroidobacteraceae bacterium]|nr:DUF1579 family protein [Steroidobacteraceae bacterium]
MPNATATNRIALLAGDWTGEETIAASKWGPGGTAVAKISARLALNDRALIQDYSAERDGKHWLAAHAVFVFDEASSAYSLFWFDNLGFAPTQPAPGEWSGETLTFTRTSPRGQTRHLYTFQNGESYSLRLESSFDGGATWIPVMEGTYARVK